MSTYLPPYPIPYAYDPCGQSAAPRVLFAAGEWLVPEDERPANWREMTGERDGAAPEKAAYLAVKPPQQKRSQWSDTPLHLTPRSGAGRPHTTHLSLAQVADLVAEGKTTAQIAKIGECSSSVVSRMRAQMFVAKPCRLCGKPTGRTAKACYCAACLPNVRRLHRKGNA